MATLVPTQLDLQRDRDLRVTWPDGRVDVWTIAQLRQLCPCAACKMQREGSDPHQLFRPATPEEVGEKPAKKSLSLTVATKPIVSASDAISVTKAEPVGNYALRLTFSDGHESGIYSWAYLREMSGAEA